MNATQIHEAALAVAELRPRRTRGPGLAAINQARREIELFKEQRALIEEVRNSLPGKASDEDAIAWMDREIPNWRLGPAPRGRTVMVESDNAE